ncbi:adenine nucleotide alpha hydrolase family protein [Chelatococcus asaccharovorans]|uniref:hypothetical protein n=1 Tax=Chelatococcus asaccharovorans TaxID=28210 RepID=UPI00224C7678|nr:hypothetical protein [Chelatococcus asaccharovorans]CAH1662480.1 conserved hypothetical protein [Chelatococcus asaccharovorans]CAH1690279.1 conserved hypothetical protein [Chelatococcus asaccharovorans]
MFRPPTVEGDGCAPSPIRLRVLSLGAGVQSTTLALMAAHGIVGPMPDLALFADTGWEPASVYEHLRWLMSPNVLPFPVHIVSAGNIRQNLLDASRGERWASIPAFTRVIQRGGRVEIGMIRRQCTGDYKIAPIRRKVRELLGLTRKRSPPFAVAEQWIGISTDEAVRIKPSFEPWQVNRWPLIERRMSRQDCLAWLRRHDYPIPPKSSCIGCPFHSNAAWRRIRDHDPDAWDDAVAIDRAIRSGLRGIRGEVYLHRSAVPLDEADLSIEADHGQLDLWPNECEGMCGV